MIDFATEPVLVALIGAFGGILLGLSARLGRFCTLGAIEDITYGGNSIRMRMWGVAIAIAIMGTFGLTGLGLFDPSRAFYLSNNWNPLASIVGGLAFGYGMALAGNCGFGALARLGGGDLRSFVIVLVMGLVAYATISGPFAVLRAGLADLITVPTHHQGIAGLVAGSLGGSTVIWGMLIGTAILLISLSSTSMFQSKGPVIWGVIVGLAVVSGWGGTYWVATAGFDTLPVVSHSFASPLGETILYIMTSSGGGLSFGVGSVFGVLIGAFAGSLIKGHFRWEACEDPRELRRQITGAALMGFGAVVALGCTIGQGISAFSVLAYSAPITFATIFLGASIGLRQLISGFE